MSHRKPLQYQEVLRILNQLPKEDADYVLAFLLAAEKRYERRTQALEQEEHELRRYRNELTIRHREKLDEAKAKLKQKQRAWLADVQSRVDRAISKKALANLTPETEAELREASRELNRVLRSESPTKPDESVDSAEG